MQTDHIYWIGGSPCSGKSSIAKLLIQEFNFTYYKVDDHLDRYISIGVDRNIPLFKRYQTMSCDQTWLIRDISTQVKEEFECYQTAFQFILEDLSEKNYQRNKVIIEGAALTPENIATIHISPHRYLAIIPSPQFQLKKYSQRTWVKPYLASCSNPDQAFQNWMARDAQFAQQIQIQAIQHNYKTIITDGAQSIKATYSIVKQHFQLNQSI